MAIARLDGEFHWNPVFYSLQAGTPLGGMSPRASWWTNF